MINLKKILVKSPEIRNEALLKFIAGERRRYNADVRQEQNILVIGTVLNGTDAL